MTQYETLYLSHIIIDAGTQARAKLNDEVASDYAEQIKNGTEFPPVIVFSNGEDYWLADGFHRYAAHKQAGAKDILADVREGNLRDAILYSVGANSHHGLQRSREDKRNAVMVMLNDTEWSGWSDREIARQCGVSQPFVSRVRSDLTDNVISERAYKTKHGTDAVMNTANIGTSPKPDFDPFSIASAQVRQDLSPEIKEFEQRKAAARAAKQSDMTELEAHVDELQESQRALESDYAEVLAENKKFEAMRIQFEQGSFEKVIAGKDEEIRVLKERLYSESEAKASWMRKANFWKEKAKELGWRDTRFDQKSEQLSDDDIFLAVVNEAEG